MNRIFLLLTFAVVLLTNGVADSLQVKFSPPQGWELTDEQHYAGGELYGYMNGGSELYREYGFENLQVQEFTLNNRQLKLEIYRMSDDTAAYGIFSVMAGAQIALPQISPYSSASPYQLVFCKGPWYISILNYEGNEAVQAQSREFARLLAAAFPPEKFNIPDRVFKLNGGNPAGIKLLCGRLALQNYLPEWMDYFAGIGHFQLYLFAPEEKDGIRHSALVQLPDPESAALFTGNLQKISNPVGQTDRQIFQRGNKSEAILPITDRSFLMAETGADWQPLQRWIARRKTLLEGE